MGRSCVCKFMSGESLSVYEEYRQRRFFWRSRVEINVEIFMRVVDIFMLFRFFLLYRHFSCRDRQSKLGTLNSWPDSCPCRLHKSEVYLAF